MMKHLDRILRLYPTEKGLVLTLGFLLMSNALALNLSDVVAVSGFLSEVGAAEILIVWAVNMLLVILTTGIQSLVVDRFNRIKLMQGMCIALLLAYVGLWAMFTVGLPPWLNYSILYLLAEQQGLFFPIVFWVLANDIFNAAQARRIFPLISSWAFAGQIMGLGIAAVFPFMPNRINISSIDLLIFNAVLYLLAFILLARRLRRLKIRQSRVKKVGIRDTLTEGWGFVRDVPSFRYLMLSLLAVYLVLTILDYHFLAQFEATPLLSEAGGFQTFYAVYYLVLTIVAIIVQGLFTSRIIERIHLKNTFFILPSITIASVAGVMAVPGLISASLGLAVPYLTKDSINESAQKSLQALVPEERRGRVSLFMDSYLYAFGTILGCITTGLAIFMSGWWLHDASLYIYLPMAFIVAGFSLWAIFKVRAVYDVSLLNWRLKRRRRRTSLTSVMKKLDL